MANVPDIISNCPPNANVEPQPPESTTETTSQQTEKFQREIRIDFDRKTFQLPTQLKSHDSKDTLRTEKTKNITASKGTKIQDSETEGADCSCYKRITTKVLYRIQTQSDIENVSATKNYDPKTKKSNGRGVINKSKDKAESESTFEDNLFNRFSMTERDKVDGFLEKTSGNDSLWKSMKKGQKRNEEEIALKLSVQLRALRQETTFDHESDRENNSLVVSCWNFVITGSILYNVVFGILRFCFSKIDEKYIGVWTFLDIFADIAYIVDILFNMRTTFLYEGLVISEPSLVRRNYLQKVVFKMDVVSAVPLDLTLRILYHLRKIELWADKIETMQMEAHFLVLCRVNKLLKLGSLFKSFATAERRTNFPNVVRILRLCLYIAIIIHWNACIFFALSDFIGLGSDTWVLGGSDESHLRDWIIDSMRDGRTAIPNDSDQIYIAFTLNSHYFEAAYQQKQELEARTMNSTTIAEATGCSDEILQGNYHNMVCVRVRETFWKEFDSGEIDFSYKLQCYMDFSYTLQVNKVATLHSHHRMNEVAEPLLVNNSQQENGERLEYLENWSDMGNGAGSKVNNNKDELSSLKWGLVDKAYKCHFSFQYIYALYWSTLTLTTIGETPLPESDLECMFMVLDFLLGVVIFASIVGNVGTMISNLQANETDFKAKLDTVKQYMYLRRVDNKLERKIIRWFDYIWHNYGYLDQLALLQILPPKLRAQIALHIHVNTLKRVTLFADCEPGLLIELVLKMKPETYSPGDFVCRKGDIGKEMYIIKQGQLAVVAANDPEIVLATLKEGSYFGEISILDIKGNINGNKRTANIKSICYTDLFALSKLDLMQVLKHYPEAHDALQQKGKDMLIRDKMYDPTLDQ